MERSRYLWCGAAEGSITWFAFSSVVWKWMKVFEIAFNYFGLMLRRAQEKSMLWQRITNMEKQKTVDVKKLSWVHYAMPAFVSLSNSNSWPLPKSFRVPRTTNRLDLSDREPRGTWSIVSAVVMELESGQVKQGQIEVNAPTKTNMITLHQVGHWRSWPDTECSRLRPQGF